MPSFLMQPIDLSYCTLCDQYFPGNDARSEHVQISTNHPKCETCDKRFPNGNSLRNHWVCSGRHNYCAVCERDFETPAGLRVHIEFASVHRDDSDDDLEDDVDDDDMYEDGWEDSLGATFFPDENEAETMASDDESIDDDEDNWEDEDDADYEDNDFDDEVFVPTNTLQIIPGAAAALRAAGGYDVPPRPRNNSGDSAMSDATDTSLSQVSNVATGSVSDDESDPFDTDEQMAFFDPAEQMPAPLTPTFEPLPEQGGYEGIAPNEVPPATVLFNCALCLEASNDTSATRCGHVFCTPCITAALNEKKACPVCRKVAGHRQLRRVYLSAN